LLVVRRGHLRAHVHERGHVSQLAHGFQVGQRVEAQLAVQVLIDDEIIGGAQHQRVAVGLGARDVLHADVATRAGLVVHHHGLAQALFQ